MLFQGGVFLGFDVRAGSGLHVASDALVAFKGTVIVDSNVAFRFPFSFLLIVRIVITVEMV